MGILVCMAWGQLWHFKMLTGQLIVIQILERSAPRSARIGYCLVRVIDIVPAAQQCDGKIVMVW